MSSTDCSMSRGALRPCAPHPAGKFVPESIFAHVYTVHLPAKPNSTPRKPRPHDATSDLNQPPGAKEV